MIDPVTLSKSKYPLLKPDAIECLKAELLPLATVVMPNIPEAELLTDCEIQTLDDAKVAAKLIQGYGCQSVLVKGGHLSGEKSTDVLYAEETFTLFEAERIETKNTHGTGCTYSAAIATHLGLGKDLISCHSGRERVHHKRYPLFPRHWGRTRTYQSLLLFE